MFFYVLANGFLLKVYIVCNINFNLFWIMGGYVEVNKLVVKKGIEELFYCWVFFFGVKIYIC